MKTNGNPETTGLEVAVIGMSGRLPGAGNITAFWENLKNGVETITSFTEEELAAGSAGTGQINDPKYVKAWGALDDIEYFDAAFFGFTPTDTKLIDPQTRIFLECSWEALEDAGYDPGSYGGFIGLFAGASDNIIWKVETRLAMADHPDAFFGSLINNKDFLSLLTSYKLDLKGPSFTMYTACSSSLTAIHLACQSILNGECDMALAGGAAVVLPNRNGSLYQPGMLNSPDGHCRAFDSRARGTVFGNGVGLILLKTLEDAIQEKDHIYAVIKGSAINNDGLRKVGFTAPSIEGQEEVIRTARQMARVEAESIGYIETHGTGTELGDPIEIEALKTAFDTPKKQFCAVGSVKTNVGHLDSAAGVTGFIKTVLALKHRLIPPSLHFENSNPKIDFADSPFYVNTRLQEWESNGTPRRAGVSSFGIGGTNAHIILEEWLTSGSPPFCKKVGPKTFQEGPSGHLERTMDNRSDKINMSYSALPNSDVGARRAVPEKEAPQLILLSANTPAALEQAAENLADYLQNVPHIDLADVAYTLAVGRKHFKCRRMAVCSSHEEVIRLLSAPADEPAQAMIEKENTALSEFEPGRDPAALEKTGRLWLQGHRFDWSVFFSGRDVRRVSLPTYPFERQYYWIEERLMKMMAQPEMSFPGDMAAAGGRGMDPVLQPRPHLVNSYVPPASELEQNICDTWKELFGFEKIGINDDFYELGGDSVKAITLTAEFEKTGLRVSITDILSNPTIKKLASSIGEISVSKELEDEIYEQRLLRDLDCLQKLNKGRGERNLFIVHPNSGLLDNYEELAMLLESTFNVYGIKVKGLEPGTEMPGTPGQMVDDYVEQILTFQEEGPYLIAGFGIGNMLAYEIGLRMETLEHRVEKIIMIAPSSFTAGLFSPGHRVISHFPGFIKQTVLAVKEKNFRKKISAGNFLVREDDDENIRKEKVKEYMDNLNTVVLSFGKIHAPLLVFQAADSPVSGVLHEGLKGLTRCDVSAVPIAGDGNSMLERPAVEKLAELIIDSIYKKI